MKKTQSISGYLGLSQEDLALILNVTRRHFSGYETGSRNIPLASKELLTQILQFINTPEAVLTSAALAAQYAQKQEEVLAMLKENEYQQELTARSIASLEPKCNGKLRALRVVEFLGQREDMQDETNRAILRSIGRKTAKSLKSGGLGFIFSLKLKLYMLQLEKLLLESEIRKWDLNAQNTGDKE